MPLQAPPIVASTSRAKAAREKAVDLHVKEVGWRNSFPKSEHRIPHYDAMADPHLKIREREEKFGGRGAGDEVEASS